MKAQQDPRTSFERVQRARLVAWAQDLQLLRIRARKLELGVRAEADERLRRIKALSDSAHASFDDLRGARQSSWRHIRRNLDDVGLRLSRSLDDAKRWFAAMPTKAAG